MFASDATVLKTTRRSLLAGLGLAVVPTSASATAVPHAVARACEAFARAVDNALAAIGTPTEDDAVERAELADAAMVKAMRTHNVKAVVIGGRLYLDTWTLNATPGDGHKAGACVVGLDQVRGL